MAVSAGKIIVRKVTHWQPTFVQQKAGGAGTYTLQLILDNGAEEHVLELTEGDADNLFDWLIASSDVHFDTERKTLIFGTRGVGS
jgi:hypothetical protein